MVKLSVVFLFLFSLAAAACGEEGSSQVSPELSRALSRAGFQLLRNPVPLIDFSLPLMEGSEQTLSALKGRPIFLNFWATWCPPCRAEAPSMERLYRRLKGRGLEMLAVDMGESRELASSFMEEFGISFPIALDEDNSVSVHYGIRSIPTTFLIDRRGNIIAAAVGGREWDSPEALAAFELLLNDEP